MPKRKISRRRFLSGTAAAATVTIVPRHVLGGPGYTAPSDVITRAVIGCGERGYHNEFVVPNTPGEPYRTLAVCDVNKHFLARAMKRAGGPCKGYTDFRRVMDQKDIDAVYVMTPPHWHALICIAAAQAGKDIYCEKPMTRFIHEGRKVVEAVKRYGVVFQIGTFGRFATSRDATSMTIHKMMTGGLVKKCPAVYFRSGSFHVREWSGRTDLQPQPVPEYLDYNMWLGPAPYKPYHPERVHWIHRGPAKTKGSRCYWDYDGGGLADMGQHYLDGFQWMYGKDATSPVEIEACAPWPAHPDACGMWGWVEMKYADGLKLVLESREWGKPYDRDKPRPLSPDDLDETDRKKLLGMPNPPRLINFEEAVKTRRRAGGYAEASHRCATLMHLANTAIRLGRKLRYDPVTEQFVGDDEANRFVDVPMRAPWHL